jgi:hypothetical protein
MNRPRGMPPPTRPLEIESKYAQKSIRPWKLRLTAKLALPETRGPFLKVPALPAGDGDHRPAGPGASRLGSTSAEGNDRRSAAAGQGRVRFGEATPGTMPVRVPLGAAGAVGPWGGRTKTLTPGFAVDNERG